MNMKATIFALALLAFAPFAHAGEAAPVAPGPHCRYVLSCTPPAKKSPPKKKKPVVKKAEPPKAPSKEQQSIVVVVVPSQPKKVEEKKDEQAPVVLGIRGALGLGVRDPSFSGLLGVRVKVPPAHLGLDIYSAFDYGMAVQLLGYTFSGPRLSHHVDVGLMWPEKLYLSAQDVPRRWDLTVGTGLEYRFTRYLSATLDWRVNIPSPAFIASHDDPVYDPSGTQVYGYDGRYLDVPAVLGNSLTQSQVLLGLMLHTF